MSIKDKNYLHLLIKKLQSGDISDDELKFLSNFFSNQSNNRNWPFDDALKNELKNKIFNNVTSKVNKEQKGIKLTSFYKSNVLKYAATALILVSIAFVWNYNSNESEVADIKSSTNKIKVGTDKATLTLEDGQYIDLEKGQNYSTINAKSTGDKLIYDNKVTIKPQLVYNYLTVPRGGQFFLQLSDGTKVWLNSESKLRYPVNFIEGEDREVELVYGEAFFDVSPSSRHNGALFRVTSRMQAVEVLGTKFNIKSYKDENMVYTTLVEGKVKVSNQSEYVYLKPNQQSQVSLLNKNIIVKDIDVYNATSWVKGVFSFEGKPLKDIMKVLSRWYDMDVVFANEKIENIKFIGVLSKNQNIEDVLISIKESGFINAFAINNKQLILK
ncbi:FecR family protein [Hwangdonia lutea]|uniref:FecR family protein n=1 Tax=Hwangdonia lutea TaxID=3075823 RepID=A0AA97HPU5_9FLAO|nr:FecR family protein [Hwangdonia sp. SCSIO 19198]WOD42225.1 FecR family protein [Hwangdonia sp. SCSIO 19198]